jgi:hypothetical protein
MGIFASERPAMTILNLYDPAEISNLCFGSATFFKVIIQQNYFIGKYPDSAT